MNDITRGAPEFSNQPRQSKERYSMWVDACAGGGKREGAERLIGRDREIQDVLSRLDTVRECGVALLLRGDAGIGKSALLESTSVAVRRQGMRVLSVAGARAEKSVPFAGVHQMLRPQVDRVRDLPRPQKDALLAAFGMSDSPTPEPFRVAVAALELLATAAQDGPLLLVVDDTRWFDDQSARVLALLARRLAPAPIAMVVGVRDGYETPLVDSGLPELRVGPLDARSSAKLLDRHAPGLGPSLRRRVLAAAAGNPLALVELPRALAAGTPEMFGLPGRLPMTFRLEQALVERFYGLPPVTQALLLVASADDQARLCEVLAACRTWHGESPSWPGDVSPALAAGLVEFDHDRIRFRYPLLPVAIYHAASPEERHHVHEALAAVMGDRPDRRAWHRAASTTTPNEELSGELERISRAAHRRGAKTFALAVAERAAELTIDPVPRQERLLDAAELAARLGQPDRAARLVARVTPGGGEPQQRGRIGLIRDMIEPGLLTEPRSVPWLLDEAERATSAGDVDLALWFLQAAATRSWWVDPDPDARREIKAATERLPEHGTDRRVLSILGICDPVGSWPVIEEAALATPPGACDPQAAYWLGTALYVTGRYDQSIKFLSTAITGLTEQEDLWLLAQALTQQAWNAVCANNWPLATAAGETAARLARETRQPLWESAACAARSMVAAIQGDEDSARELLRQAETIALPLGARAVLADVQMARALTALGLGRYEEAFDDLRRTFVPDDPACHHFRAAYRIADYAEAALHSGRSLEARRQLAEWETRVRQSTPPTFRLGLLYARSLLAEDGNAEGEFKAALGKTTNGYPFFRARLLLEYGGWLRRRRRITEARAPLRAARDTFEALGARPWAERALQELRASRESRRHQPDAWTELTEQEQQVAHLAAQGLSNRDIAQRLYVSHRTVGAHLYRIFPKLGIASRGQLALALGSHLSSGQEASRRAS